MITYGQEYTNTTYKLAKMNLAIRGIACNLGEKAADTFHDDQHKDLKADFIMANPPFNQKAWRAENELTNDPRWHGYEVPPTSNANYGWILNIVSKLSANQWHGGLSACQRCVERRRHRVEHTSPAIEEPFGGSHCNPPS